MQSKTHKEKYWKFSGRKILITLKKIAKIGMESENIILPSKYIPKLGFDPIGNLHTSFLKNFQPSCTWEKSPK